jgi:hypothetical protein
VTIILIAALLLIIVGYSIWIGAAYLERRREIREFKRGLQTWKCGCKSFGNGQWLMCKDHAFVPLENGARSALPGGPEQYGLKRDPNAGPPPYSPPGALTGDEASDTVEL